MANVEIKTYHPIQLDEEDWRELQGVQRLAFASTLEHRDQEEVDCLIDWDNPQRFRQTHIYPQLSERFSQDQSYANPWVAVATVAGKLAGFAYAADNMSGATARERQLKFQSIVKRYYWLREFAVDPNQQQDGIARQLGMTLLERANRFQPVTAYIWPDEIPSLQPTLERYGLEQKGERSVRLFGPDSDEVRQVRMQGKSAHLVLGKLIAATEADLAHLEKGSNRR